MSLPRFRFQAPLSFLLLVTLSFGCPAKDAKEGTPATDDKTAANAKTATPAPKEVELPAGTGPVAKVNGTDVSRDAFNREYRQTMERYQRAQHDVKPALRERLKDNIVRRLVDAEVIRQQAVTLDIKVTDAEREEKWAAHKKRYGSEEAFKAFLERSGTSADDVRSQFETNLLREEVFAHVADQVKLDPKEVRDYYDQNGERYNQPEQVKASHILVRLTPNATPQEKAEKKKRIEEALAKVKAKGADFAAIARDYSEDPTKDRGGDLGFFGKGRMVKPFEDTVWKMKPNQISGVVETQFGYHIIKKIEDKPARKVPFDEAKPQIERSLEARKRNQVIRDSLTEWKNKATIEIFVKGDEAIIKAGQTAPEFLKPTPGPMAKPFESGTPIKPTVPVSPADLAPHHGSEAAKPSTN